MKAAEEFQTTEQLRCATSWRHQSVAGGEMFTVTIEKVEEGYKIATNNAVHQVAKDLRETELWVRANFQVVPEEWAELKAKLDSTGKASIERSAGKFSQET